MGQTVGQYLGKTKGPVINQLPVNKAYRENAAESTFERYLRTGRKNETIGEWKDRTMANATRVVAIDHGKGTITLDTFHDSTKNPDGTTDLSRFCLSSDGGGFGRVGITRSGKKARVAKHAK
jgi:hypothetical protein